MLNNQGSRGLNLVDSAGPIVLDHKSQAHESDASEEMNK